MNSCQTAIIVGSGLSAIAAAHSLLSKKNIKVVMLDYGNKKDSVNDLNFPLFLTNQNRDELLNIKDFKWGKGELKDDVVDSGRHFKEKYFYADSKKIIFEKKNSIVNISLAVGGLSNLWGGAILPIHESDIEEWPISKKDLIPHYEYLNKFLRISSAQDNLNEVFKPNLGSAHSFNLGEQIKDFVNDLDAGKEKLNSAGIYFGRSRLAIDQTKEFFDTKFPYGPIFNSSLLLKEMCKNPLFEYRPNILVKNYKESDGRVCVRGISVKDQLPVEVDGDKAFIAAGPINSTLIIMNSLKLHAHTFSLKTNQNSFFPLIRFKRTKLKRDAIENNIAQLFLEVKNDLTFDRFVHLQIYQYGEYVLEPIKRILGPLTGIFKFLFRPFLERIIIVQSMLHSDFSDHLLLEPIETSAGEWRLKITGKPNSKMSLGYKNLSKILVKNLKIIKGMPISKLILVDPPGASNHLGCSFPMKENPDHSKHESDTLGRVGGGQNVHIIDSTVLPSLPAPTISYTLMANACRIAEKAFRND